MNKSQLQAIKVYFNYYKGKQDLKGYNLIDNKKVITNGYSIIVFNTDTDLGLEKTKNNMVDFLSKYLFINDYDFNYKYNKIDLESLKIEKKDNYTIYKDLEISFNDRYTNNIIKILGGKCEIELLKDKNDYYWCKITNVKNGNYALLLFNKIY